MKRIIVKKTHLCCNVSFFLFLICALIFSSGSSTASAIPCLDTSCPMVAKDDINLQELKGKIGQSSVSEGKIEVSSMGQPRKLQHGPGSSRPNCTSKCGTCTPCKLVLVAVPPMAPEYYPLVWRCKCGGKLYKP